jgi:S1-C subfamily serine protease
MKAQFTFLSGARAGQVAIFSQSYIGLGRHPHNELQFDPDEELDVSALHAGVTREGELYVLRDLGSTNGTFVNGRRLTADHVLATGDVVRLGSRGPELQFTAIGEGRRSPPPPASAAPGTVVFGSQPELSPLPPKLAPPAEPRAAQAPRRTPGPGTQTKIQAAVAAETRHQRRTTWGLLALLVVLAGAYVWQSKAASRALAEQRAALVAQVDSLMAQMGDLASRSEGLRSALDSARGQAEQLRRQLSEAPDDARTITELRRRLDQAVQHQRTLAGAALLDASGIAARNRDAIALVFVQHPDGRIYTGTAFVVRTDPQGGYLVTNKHVVSDSATGRIAERIGVVPEGTHQNFRADVAALHPSADVALLRVSVHRGFPAVVELADGDPLPSMGSPTATIGFPLGLDLRGGEDWRTLGVASTLSLGTVSRTLPDLLQLDSYGAQGSSGSPIFNRDGRVVGVLFGGQPGSGGRIIYGVPVRAVHELLAASP